MATKLTFRARTLDATKSMSIYRAEDLPELADSNAINRSVPAMPSGMEKEEESEKHLQDILDAQSRNRDDPSYTPAPIPVPEVLIEDNHNLDDIYQALYQNEYKPPRAYIHVQPFTADADQPAYDMDDEDETYLGDVLRNERKFEVDDITFEGMLDRLEQNSGVNVVSAKEAKLLLKEDDELILAVYDYWVDKRLRLKQPLILTVKSDKREVSSGSGTSTTNIGGTGPGGSGGGGSSGGQGGGGQGNQNQSNTSTSPYIAFRRRTEKMQTRKNRKNDEVSYEKMLKLRRDLSQAIVLLEMVKRREKTKKEHLNLTADIFERRYHVGDFDGRIFAEMRAARLSKILQPHRPSFGEQNWFHNSGDMMQITGDMAGTIPRRERHKSNKKRKSSKGSGRSVHHGHSSLAFSSIQPSFLGGQISIGGSGMGTSGMSSDDEYGMLPSQSSDLEDEDDGYFSFKRKRNCQYLRPKLDDYDSDDCGLDTFEESPHKFLRLDDLEVEKEMNPSLSNKLKYSLASLSVPKLRFIGFARRRISRGGRVVLDRASIRDPMAAFHAAQLLSNSDRWGDEFISGTVVSGLNSGSRANSHERLQHFRPLTPPNCRDNWTTSFSNGQSNTLSDTLYNSWLPIHPVKPIIKEQLSPGTLSRHIQRHRSGGGTNVKTVSLDPVTAQNAATAVVTSDYLDIFGSL